MKFQHLTAIVFSLSLLAGCASDPVAVWEREYLDRPEMGWEIDPALAGFRQHTYDSKEAASGGTALGGGGCGCK